MTKITRQSAAVPKVSVIMNCLNSSRYLREAIDSVYAQTYKDWEIIFWDNASTDASAEIAKSYDERLKYFRSDETVPLGKARNWAIEKASGEYIAFLDCDDMWLPRKMEKQVLCGESRPEVDFFYSNYFRIIMPKDKSLILAWKRKQPEGNVFEQFLYHYSAHMLTVMLRRTALDKLETLFDEKLNLSEEYDLFMRILYSSNAAYIHEPLGIYRVHPKMSSIKYESGYPEEIDYVLRKLRKMDPLMESKYSSAIKHAYAGTEYVRAKINMSQNRRLVARQQIYPYAKDDYRYFVLYLATYLPGSVWRMLQFLNDKNIFRFIHYH